MKCKQLIDFSLLFVSLFKVISHGAGESEKYDTSLEWREEYAYTLGLQAYITTYPFHRMARIRYAWTEAMKKPEGFRGITAPHNTFWHYRPRPQDPLPTPSLSSTFLHIPCVC